MCKLAIEGISKFEVSDFELSREGISYSIITVRHFKEVYPNDELYFLIGSDMLLTFDEWRDYQEILSKVNLAVVSRENGDRENLLHKADELSKYGNIVVVDVPPMEVSSTEVRKNVRFDKDYCCNLSEKVVQYIKSNSLYR
jgi:nicotinate-nucleotide adenylyltransferase